MAELFDADDELLAEPMREKLDDPHDAFPVDETAELSLNEKRALALFAAVGDFVETLQEITVARGSNCEDDFDRACSAIAGMQQLAVEVLRKHGFVPRRETIDD